MIGSAKLKRPHPNPQDNIPHFFLIHTGSIVLLCYRFGWIYHWTVENTSKNNREYFDIKLKIDVDQYNTVRIMKSQNPGITEEYLRSLQTGAIPIKISKMYATSTGSIFYNSFRGSSIDENVPVNFKINDNMKLTINQIKCPSSGTFTVSGFIKWVTDMQQRENKKLRKQ